jgi:hypothetical protein
MRLETAVSASTVELRPYRNLITRGIVAVLALTMPVFAVIYWLTVPTGAWPVVLGIQVVILLVAVVGVVAFLSTTIRLDASGVRERGYFGHVNQIEPDQVHSILLIDLYQSSTLETQPQLFVTGSDGRVLLRMRGQFWPIESMKLVAERLDVPMTTQTGSVTLAELRRTSPDLLYWFEKFPRFGR